METELIYKTRRLYFLFDYLAGGLILAIAFSIMPFLKFHFDFFFFVFLVLGGLSFILYPELKRRFEEYALTPTAVIHRKKYPHLKNLEIPYSQIKTIKVENNLFSEFFKLGNILIDSNNEKIAMVGVNSNEVYKIIQQKKKEIEDAKKRKREEILKSCLKILEEA